MYTVINPATIVYDYLICYLGRDKFRGKIIVGASVRLAIHAYKEGKEIKFTDEPKSIHGRSYDMIYRVSFNREKLFNVEKNLEIDNLFRLIYGWDKIEAEVVGYTLEYLDECPAEMKRDLPDKFKDLPCVMHMEVTEKEFKDSLKRHFDDFGISDNVNVLVPSVSFLQFGKDGDTLEKNKNS